MDDRAEIGRGMLRMHVALPGLAGAALVQSYLAAGHGDPADLRSTVVSLATDVGLALSEDGYSFDAAAGGALLPGIDVERRGDDEFEQSVTMLSGLSRVLANAGIDQHSAFADALEAVEAEASPSLRM